MLARRRASMIVVMNSTDSATVPTVTDQGPLLESQARTVAMLVHIIAAASIVISGGLLGFLAPLILWLVFRERSALVEYHGKLNLNLQLTMLLVGAGAVVLGIATLGIGLLLTIPVAIAYVIFAIVISITTGLSAYRGEYARMPLVIPFIR